MVGQRCPLPDPLGIKARGDSGEALIPTPGIVVDKGLSPSGEPIVWLRHLE